MSCSTAARRPRRCSPLSPAESSLAVTARWIGSGAWHRSRSNRGSPPRPRRSVEAAPETDVAERKEALDSDVDDLLDEIDDVLETNAEDFVKSFIQKGGQ